MITDELKRCANKAEKERDAARKLLADVYEEGIIQDSLRDQVWKFLYAQKEPAPTEHLDTITDDMDDEGIS